MNEKVKTSLILLAVVQSIQEAGHDIAHLVPKEDIENFIDTIANYSEETSPKRIKEDTKNLLKELMAKAKGERE